MIDEAGIAKKKDVSDIPQGEWIKNASNTVSTHETLLHDLTLDYEHFMNNVRNAGALYEKLEDEMLEVIKNNYQDRLRWEKRQDEITAAGPDYKAVLMELGCKPHEIQTNLKMALQTKAASQVQCKSKKNIWDSESRRRDSESHIWDFKIPYMGS